MPPASSAIEIKRAFRKLAKSWHPDKWSPGTPQQAKAHERMAELNAAFQAVRHAPLRYHIEGHPRVSARATAKGREVRRESVPVSDHAEWAIRFVLGALVGVAVNAFLVWGGRDLSPLVWVLVPALCGLASAYFGNEFWGWLIEGIWWLDFP